MKKVIKIIIFLVIFSLNIIKLGYVFMPRYVTFDIIKSYMQMPKNAIDVLFVGDSDLYSGISPMELYQNYGITSANYGSPAASNVLMYYMLKEALKTQSPKVVIMNGTTIFNETESEGMRAQAVDLMPNDAVKWELINDKNYNFSLQDKIDMLFPFFRFHDRYLKLSASDFNKENNISTYSRGYVITRDKKRPNHNSEYMQDENKKIDFKTKLLPEYVLKSKALCESLGIKFIFVTMPDSTAWDNAKYEKLSSWTKENNIEYLDLNEKIDDMGLNFTDDTDQFGMHMNIIGASKVSKYIGSYLKNNYTLTNHLSENSSYWQNDLNTYLNEKERAINDLKNR